MNSEAINICNAPCFYCIISYFALPSVCIYFWTVQFSWAEVWIRLQKCTQLKSISFTLLFVLIPPLRNPSPHLTHAFLLMHFSRLSISPPPSAYLARCVLRWMCCSSMVSPLSVLSYPSSLGFIIFFALKCPWSKQSTTKWRPGRLEIFSDNLWHMFICFMITYGCF